MDNNDNFYTISKKQRQQILLNRGLPMMILAGLVLIVAIVLLVTKKVKTFIAILLCILAIGLLVLGLTPLLFWKKAQKEKYIDSRLYNDNLNRIKKSGVKVSKEQSDKLRFQNDPIFRDKVIAKVHKEEDDKYRKRVSEAENKLAKLQKEREKEIKRLEAGRWADLGNGLSANATEGTFKFNDVVYPYSLIEDVYLNDKQSTRTVTNDKQESEEIATCNHLGVMLQLGADLYEKALITATVDLSSSNYKTKLEQAETMISTIKKLANTPMPESFLQVVEEPTVLAYDKKIEAANANLEEVKAILPTYEIPERYLADSEDLAKLTEEITAQYLENTAPIEHEEEPTFSFREETDVETPETEDQPVTVDEPVLENTDTETTESVNQENTETETTEAVNQENTESATVEFNSEDNENPFGLDYDSIGKKEE